LGDARLRETPSLHKMLLWKLQRFKLVGAAGIEPATPRLEIWCSIQLSYAPLSKIYHSDYLARLLTLFPAN
jgi:hypothetical protein